MPRDAVLVFEHDHAEVNRLVLDLGELITAVEGGAGDADLGARIDAYLTRLRDDLFLHVVREEEGLFPFVSTNLPDLAPSVDELIGSHDEICGTLARMVHLANTEARLDVIAPVFRRFEVAYARHATIERALLDQVGPRLTEAQQVELADWVRGL